MKRTTLTFWSGLRTIGGNIVEITYGSDRIIFDFGLVYHPASSMIQANQHRKKRNYVADLLKLDMIPSIDGIYSYKNVIIGEPFLNQTPVPQEMSNITTAVFISHLHLDHMGAIDTLSPSIPIYMSKDSKKLYDALTKIGEGLINDREVSSFTSKEKLQIGKISVKAYPIDHDIIGAAAFLIETPDLKILYSGDFRLHGLHPEHFQNLINDIKHQQIDLLLIEGTTIQPTKEEGNDSLCHTETDVIQVGEHLLNQYQGLAFFNMYHRNIERLNHLLQVAKSTKRIAVLELETAYLANEFLSSPSFVIYDDGNLQHSDWGNHLLKKYNRVTPNILNENPGNYFIQTSFKNILHLLDLNVKDSVYLHTNGIPLGNFDPDYQKLLSVLKHLAVDYKPLHVSGHASEQDILTCIDTIQPKVVIPWHSQYPELVKPIDPKQTVFYPEAKVTYVYEDQCLKQKRNE